MKQLIKNIIILLLIIPSLSLYAMNQYGDEVKLPIIRSLQYIPKEKKGETSKDEREALKLVLEHTVRSDGFIKKVGEWSTWNWDKAVIKKSKNSIYVYYLNGVIDTLYLDKYGKPVQVVYSDKMSIFHEVVTLSKFVPYVTNTDKNKFRLPPIVSELKESQKNSRELHDDLFEDFGGFIQEQNTTTPELCETFEGCTKKMH